MSSSGFTRRRRRSDDSTALLGAFWLRSSSPSALTVHLGVDAPTCSATWRRVDHDLMFGNMFVEPDGDFLRLAVAVVSVVLARLHARSRAAREGRVLLAVAVRDAGHDGDDLGEPLPDRLSRSRTAVAVALRHGCAEPRFGTGDRSGDEVLRARRARLRFAALRHVDDLRRHRHPGNHGRCRAISTWAPPTRPC